VSVFTPKIVKLRDGAAITLRSPEHDDAARLLDYLDVVRKETQFLMWGPGDDLPDLEFEQKWIDDRRADDGGVTVVAEVDGHIVSICGVDRQGPFGGVRHSAVLGISILQAWCGRGLGTLLMNELIGYVQGCPDLDVLELGVFSDNGRAIRLYERLGFEQTGRRRWRIKREGRYMDELIMSRWVGAPEASSV
jgi:RimJ/RimL family protein N-acetyltransferase